MDVAIKADPLRIAQLFSNLLGNAVTHGNPKQPIRVTASVNKGHLEVAVTNGGGEPIPDAAREYLFLPFYRGKVKPHQQGLGLGLYIASQIAQAHGGRIDLELRPKQHASPSECQYRSEGPDLERNVMPQRERVEHVSIHRLHRFQ